MKTKHQVTPTRRIANSRLSETIREPLDRQLKGHKDRKSSPSSLDTQMIRPRKKKTKGTGSENKASTSNKPGAPTLITNAERIQERLFKMLNKSNVISPIQSGFRQRRQTKENILAVVQKVANSLNNRTNNKKWKAITLLFVIAAAFDTVWHEGLVNKLIKAKVANHLIFWIKDFLTSRSFSVRIDHTLSEPKQIARGVPQGAVLSPLLFSVFINDVPELSQPERSYTYLFADDMVVVHIYEDDESASALINTHLKQLEKWPNNFRLSMAVSKCEYILFYNSRRRPDDLNLTMYGASIGRFKDVQFLGVTLDEKLSFTNYVQNFKKKCADRLNILRICANKSWCLSKKTLLNLYNSLVRSLFEYVVITKTCMHPKIIQQLQVIQNAALRIILHKPFDHISGKHTSNDEISRLGGLPDVATRLDELADRYMIKALLTGNPIILECLADYDKNYSKPENEHTSPIGSWRRTHPITQDRPLGPH